jgi:hypothetical protein
MFSLIKRSFDEGMVLLIILFLFIVILASYTISSVISSYTTYNSAVGFPSIIGLQVPLMVAFMPIVFTAFGANLMYTDRNKKISSFLCTMATTRKQILIAKFLSGILIIASMILCFAILDTVLLKLYSPLVPGDPKTLLRVFLVVFCVNVSGYVFGLQMGWSKSRILPALGALVFSIAIASLILIKGIENEMLILLLLFTVSSLVRTWQKFMAAAL